jgi:quercetin dioxygenase-like cupin family protein
MTRPEAAARVGRSTVSNACWYREQLIIFLVIGEDTAGRFSLLRVHGVQGAEPFPHVHTREDETLYVLAGALTVEVGGETLRARAGEIITIPRRLAHQVRYDGPEVTFLQQFSPAGCERFFHELSEPAEYLGLPPHPVPLDPARMAATAARYGCIVTAPIPSHPES